MRDHGERCNLTPVPVGARFFIPVGTVRCRDRYAKSYEPGCVTINGNEEVEVEKVDGAKVCVKVVTACTLGPADVLPRDARGQRQGPPGRCAPVAPSGECMWVMKPG